MQITFRVAEITRYSGGQVKVTLAVKHGREIPPWPVTGELVLKLTRQDEIGQFDIEQEWAVTLESE